MRNKEQQFTADANAHKCYIFFAVREQFNDQFRREYFAFSHKPCPHVTLAPKLATRQRRRRRSRKKISISISIAAKLDHLRRRNTCAFRLPATTGLHIHFAAVEKARRVLYCRVIDPFAFYRGASIGLSSIALPDDSNRRDRIYESASHTLGVLKTNAFMPLPSPLPPQGHFLLNPRARDRAQTIPAWRENIFSHRAIGTRGSLLRFGNSFPRLLA